MNSTSVIYVCPCCDKRYTLGVDGTIEGCDKCMTVIRNALDGTVIEEDVMTDMENV